MNGKTLRLLIVLNAILLIGLAFISYTPQQVRAQLGGRGDYLILSGAVTGRDDLDAVYVLDVNQQRIAALTFDTRNGKLEQIDTRDISSDARGSAR